MIYKKFLILLLFSSFYMASALSIPTPSLPEIPHLWEKTWGKTWENTFDFPLSFNLNPIKMLSYIKNNPWKTLSILAPIVAYKLYYDEEVKKRAHVIRNCIIWKHNQVDGKNAKPIAQTCYHLWLPFIKDSTVEKAVDQFVNGALDDTELMKKVLQFPTLADYLYYLWIPGWFK